MERVYAPVISGTKVVKPLDERSFFIPPPAGFHEDIFPKDTIDHVFTMLDEDFIKLPSHDKIQAEGTVAARKQLEHLVDVAKGVGRLICIVTDTDKVTKDHAIIVGTAFYVAPSVIATIHTNIKTPAYETVAHLFSSNVHVNEDILENLIGGYEITRSEGIPEELKEKLTKHGFHLATPIDHFLTTRIIPTKTIYPNQPTKFETSNLDFRYIQLLSISHSSKIYFLPKHDFSEKNETHPIALIAYSSQYSRRDVIGANEELNRKTVFMDSIAFGRNNKFISPGLLDIKGSNDHVWAHQASSTYTAAGGVLIDLDSPETVDLFIGVHIGSFPEDHWNHGLHTFSPLFSNQWFSKVFVPFLKPVLAELPRSKLQQIKEYLPLCKDHKEMATPIEEAVKESVDLVDQAIEEKKNMYVPVE